MINLPKRLQSIKLSFLRKACTYCLAIQVSIPLISVIYFENLYITDINLLYPFLLAGRAKIKSKVKVKKRTGEKSISYRNL